MDGANPGHQRSKQEQNEASSENQTTRVVKANSNDQDLNCHTNAT